MAEKVWTAKEVEKVLLLAQDTISLNMKIDSTEDGETEIGTLIEDSAPGPEELFLSKERNDIVRECIRETLKPREQKIIELRFGFDDDNPRSLEEVGKIFNLTRERVRQIEQRALRRLRFALMRSEIKEELQA